MAPPRVLGFPIRECSKRARSLPGESHGTGQVAGRRGMPLYEPCNRAEGLRTLEGLGGVAEESMKGRV